MYNLFITLYEFMYKFTGIVSCVLVRGSRQLPSTAVYAARRVAAAVQLDLLIYSLASFNIPALFFSRYNVFRSLRYKTIVKFVIVFVVF